MCFCRSWDISKKGELTEAAVREKAHKDRVTAILWKKGFLYSVSYDGFVKMWDASSLELVQEVKKAHDGQRVQCAAAGPDNFLYTGGDDKVGQQSLVCGVLFPAAVRPTGCLYNCGDEMVGYLNFFWNK